MKVLGVTCLLNVCAEINLRHAYSPSPHMRIFLPLNYLVGYTRRRGVYPLTHVASLNSRLSGALVGILVILHLLPAFELTFHNRTHMILDPSPLPTHK